MSQTDKPALAGQDDPREACFARGDRIDPGPRRLFYPVLRPGVRESVSAYVTSPCFQVVWSHWESDLSYPCCGRAKGCPWCLRDVPARKAAYACGVDLAAGLQCIVQVTHNALKYCSAVDDPRSLTRGWLITLQRRGDLRNSPVSATVNKKPPIPGRFLPLPSPFELRAAILTLLKIPPLINPETGEVEDRYPRWQPTPINPTFAMPPEA